MSAMSGSDSSIDALIVDFDDESISENMYECGDQGQGGGKGGTVTQYKPHSVTSPSASMINTGSTSFANCGPNSSITSSANWVLGVRHLSFDSNTLNQRMAKRGKHFVSDVYNTNTNTNYNFVQKRDTKYHLSHHRMDAIEEDSAESFDANNYQRNDFNVFNDKRYAIPSTNRQSTSKDNCERFVCQPICYKQNNVLDVKSNKSMINSAKGKPFPNPYPTTEDNAINDINCGKRTKNCDKIIDISDKNKTKLILPINEKNCHQMKSSVKLSTKFKRSVNSVTLSAEQELQRYRHQRFCETISLITLIFGLLLVIFTPFLLIPIWVIPNEYSTLFRNLFFLSLLTSVLLMSLASLTGNIYWYYDLHQNKWKWFFHCGKGPVDHYWGATLLHNHKPVTPLAKLRSSVSMNV